MKQSYVFKKVGNNEDYQYLAKRYPRYSKVRNRSSIAHTSDIGNARIVHGEEKALVMLEDLKGWGEYEMVEVNKDE